MRDANGYFDRPDSRLCEEKAEDVPGRELVTSSEDRFGGKVGEGDGHATSQRQEKDSDGSSCSGCGSEEESVEQV